MERQKRASEAWIAHKAGDGSESVYYYNQLTEESTWERPEGFKGDEGKASSNPVPVSSGGRGALSAAAWMGMAVLLAL